jgi:hypothetical protein
MIPLLSKEGSRVAAGWSVQGSAKRLLIHAREALLIQSVRFAEICKERATRGLWTDAIRKDAPNVGGCREKKDDNRSTLKR